MKLIRYQHDGQVAWGLQVDDAVLPASVVWADGPRHIDDLLHRGPEAMAELQQRREGHAPTLGLDSVRLLCPLCHPKKVIGLAGNYAEHILEFGPAGGNLPDDPRATTTPRPFLMPHTALADPDSDIDWPVYSEQLDYEVELAVIVGRPCKEITPADARDCIAGYAIANDLSARSVSFRQGRAERQPKDGFFDWLHGKWADGFCPVGPAIVTADEIADPQNLSITCTVNGEVRQQANTELMIFDVYELVSFISQLMTLTSGDIIATGTPAGVGAARQRFLSAGDEIVCEIEQLGRLRNTIGPRPEAFYTPCGG
jgi:2-keto-4-pentenoate hydratase/2-oxohepta-3-ene-1,7-dioic acid hydratase in catechol pathway